MLELISALTLLLMVLDPIGNVPFFAMVLKDVPSDKRDLVAKREALIACIILFVFMVGGKTLLDILHITQSALGLAGGIVLFIIALKMVFPPSNHETFTPDADPLIFPLATPAIAGPSAIATVVIMTADKNANWLVWSLVILIATIVMYLTMRSSIWMSDKLGPRVLKASEKLIGLLLIAVGIQMCINGIESAFYKV